MSIYFPSRPNQRIVIVGAGIVGSCLAAVLSETFGQNLILLDRDIRELPGSTGHAPGFIGQYNEISALTELAKRSVRFYQGIDDGFDQVGGLEIGTGAALEERCEKAKAVGLEARLLNKEEVLGIASGLVRMDTLSETGTAGLLFPSDGTANAIRISLDQQSKAASNGATLLDADVIAVRSTNRGRIIDSSRGLIECNTVIVCTGIWASQLIPSFSSSVVTVSHPYSYSLPHDDGLHRAKSPFVRWPSHHVYARDHGHADGLGSYAHAPVPVSSAELVHSHSAFGRWESSFDSVLDNAYTLLPATKVERFEQGHKFNGLFSVTPDGLPLVGTVEGGLWCAVAVWVTHAAGSARLLADMLLGRVKAEDEELGKALDPKRFDSMVPQDLERRALGKYNDIYNKKAEEEIA